MAAARGLWVAWLVGQIARDATWATGILFYIPSPVVAGALLLLAARAWRQGKRRRLALYAALAVLPVVFVVSVENRLTRAVRPATRLRALPAASPSTSTSTSLARPPATPPAALPATSPAAPPASAASAAAPAPPAAPLRLVHWNVFDANAGWERIRSSFMKERADICILSEVPHSVDMDAVALSLGPDYECERAGLMTVIVRGKVRNGQWLERRDGLRLFSFVWRRGGEELRVLLVDMASNPLRSRGPRLQRLTELMRERRPDIVVGDFNAPRRSRALSPLPEGFVHAYDAAGRGWSYTWPVPCPVYALDQCILGERIAPVRYGLETTLYSDHRRQVLDFAINSPAPKAESSTSSGTSTRRAGG